MKGGLTLDSKSGWETGGDSGPAIIPGDPAKSLLIQSLSHLDEDLKMPPKDKLSKGEIETLTQWIAKGAPDPRVAVRKSTSELEEGRKHWAFQPVSDPALPKASTSHPVDAFIQEKLKEKHLTPNPLATRLDLIRRATYDLTGLPPTASDIENFLKDPNSEELAFGKVVDRLLASPQYGEKWGRHWLDIARYADTTGCSSDWPIDDAWKYRDWVINAFNNDKPFDQFITEQLAGDLLAMDQLKSEKNLDVETYQNSIIATGFLAISKRYSVAPGTVPHLTIGDTLDQTWQALQGLSLSCARCHDHKFDPIPTADYYALYGIFDSSIYPYAGAENNQMAPLLVGLDPPEKSAKAMDAWTRKLPGPTYESKPRTLLLSNANRWGFEYHEESNHVVDRLPISPWISSGGLAVIQNQNSPFTHLLPYGIKLVHFQGSFEKSTLTRRVRWTDPAHPLRSLALDFQLADLWNGEHQSFSFTWKSVEDNGKPIQLFSITKDGIVRFIDGSEAKIAKTSWNHFNWTSNANQTQLELRDRSGTVLLSKSLSQDLLPSLRQEGDLILELSTAKTNGSRAACISVDNIVAECGALPTFITPPEKYVRAASIKDTKQLNELKAQANELYDEVLSHKPPTAFAMWEGTPKNSAIQKRGELRDPGKIVQRANLQILGGQKLTHPDRESGRRELAAWLMDESNPLTLRVFVNRAWQWHFGQGLVKTSNDFGHTGAKPTHPELLDHLVQVFREKGLSLKAMHRYLMLTHSYRQASNPSLQAKERDPENLWLSHYTQRRLLAEEVRDSILFVSGLLETKPSHQAHPFPPYHKRNWSQHGPFSLSFEANYASYNHQRRSLYLPSVRLLPDPFLSIFDAADSNLSVAQRGETNSPLQGLALMNSQLMLKASDALASQILEKELSSEASLNTLHHQIFGVNASPALLKTLQQHYRAILAQTGADPKEAYSMIAQSLLSSNAFLYPF